MENLSVTKSIEAKSNLYIYHFDTSGIFYLEKFEKLPSGSVLLSFSCNQILDFNYIFLKSKRAGSSVCPVKYNKIGTSMLFSTKHWKKWRKRVLIERATIDLESLAFLPSWLALMPALQTLWYTHILPPGLVLLQLVVYILQLFMASFAVRLSHGFFLTSHVKHAHAPKQRGNNKKHSVIYNLILFQLCKSKSHMRVLQQDQTPALLRSSQCSNPWERSISTHTTSTQYFRHCTPQFSLVFVSQQQLWLSLWSISNHKTLTVAFVKIILFRGGFRIFKFLKMFPIGFSLTHCNYIADRSFHFTVKQERLEKYIMGSVAG